MVSDQLFVRYVKKFHPDLYRSAISYLDNTASPTQKEIDYLRHRASFYKKESNLTFIACFVAIFDPRAILLDTRLSIGTRLTLSKEIGTSPENISKLFTIAKTRYLCINKFNTRIGEIVNDFKNM